ncbi:hypothetical protein [Methanococcus aeolicus]|uniref:Uncharacterized protein n=1 Tax=Methanococcus aeolicus (strain ATCC BAA-1280 / DSM 17508 / OCM 812 / Nankai-3) TaxID=419665 RepID=A6UVH8_META3|nr:hypothetical protein [Methanococcus aeolicus]ABR56500.1 conserved hypothetical protein [Methanococcus aeolicus Nankai-3]UXM84502.1 hypothetical protein N6C89_07115 [Methanococcus aeolicus]
MESWNLKYKTKCYNCGKIVDQIIEIYPNQAFVKCSNCGATRYYILKTVEIDKGNIIEEEKDKKRKFDNWLLEKEAKCYNCNTLYIQDILITESGMYVRCRNCGFARYYWFHMMEIPNK